jgi:hypothetical protein
LGAFNVLVAWTGEFRHDLYERAGASAGIPLVEP